MLDSKVPVFHPTYFPSIVQYIKMWKYKTISFEVEDNYQKQTYRNRCYILGPNGKQLLNIPIQKIAGKQKTRDIRIDYSEDWQKMHLRSLVAAYSSSPFFEFYIDDLMPVLTHKETFLLDLNIKTFQVINELIQEEITFAKTFDYKENVSNDYRSLVNAKKEITTDLHEYTQVFSTKFGFVKNLSILDLLFMEGPNTSLYLEKNN